MDDSRTWVRATRSAFLAISAALAVVLLVGALSPWAFLGLNFIWGTFGKSALLLPEDAGYAMLLVPVLTLPLVLAFAAAAGRVPWWVYPLGVVAWLLRVVSVFSGWDGLNASWFSIDFVVGSLAAGVIVAGIGLGAIRHIRRWRSPCTQASDASEEALPPSTPALVEQAPQPDAPEVGAQ